MNDEQAISIIKCYGSFIEKHIPELKGSWPIINGFLIIPYKYGNYNIFILKNASPYETSTLKQEILPKYLITYNEINQENIDAVRSQIYKSCLCDKDSYVLIINDDLSNVNNELQILFEKHKQVLGIIKMKIFLSHKGIDKQLVIDYKETLSLLGFEVWLDDDAMPAGSNLIRSIHQGIIESCAIVFFITDDFKDESWIAKEVDYAMQKKVKDNNFAIITIVFSSEENVPEILKDYVYKKVSSPLEGLREILRGLPIEVGKVQNK